MQAVGGELFGAAAQGMFGGGDPYAKAKQAMAPIPGMLTHYLQPWEKAGTHELGALQHQYGGLMAHPDQQLAHLGAGFHTDPGYQFQVQQATGAANRAAAAGGMAGTPAAQYNAAKAAGNLADQNYQSYLHNAMGLYGQGLSGASDIMHQGFGAVGQHVGGLTDYYDSLAHLAAGSAQHQNQMAAGIGSAIGQSMGHGIDQGDKAAQSMMSSGSSLMAFL